MDGSSDDQNYAPQLSACFAVMCGNVLAEEDEGDVEDEE